MSYPTSPCSGVRYDPASDTKEPEKELFPAGDFVFVFVCVCVCFLSEYFLSKPILSLVSQCGVFIEEVSSTLRRRKGKRLKSLKANKVCVLCV